MNQPGTPTRRGRLAIFGLFAGSVIALGVWQVFTSEPATSKREATPETVISGPLPWLNLGSAEPSMPGIQTPSAPLDVILAQCLTQKGKDYKARTEHLKPDGQPTFKNRLTCETSPYLLQHAHNPVNWYPWGDEAFARAKERNVPVLLSIGYSTCHWCHVMERESFEDLEIAEFINRNFVAIKVDREERPDIDDVYMAAVTLLAGRGGWPMTTVLTPNREPFFGGTYFPPRASARGKGFLEILTDLSAEYRDEPDKVVAKAKEITARLNRSSQSTPGQGVPTAAAISRTVLSLAGGFDPIYGGFRGAPKFPTPVNLELLLRYNRRTGDQAALDMATLTLERMAKGGIYDQVGGGFHRYSTDARWLVPHFEKMLYDNAQLVSVYLEAWQITKRDDFRRIVLETLDYVAREMTHSRHGFYSATDADSLTPSGEQEEGYFFTWTEDELMKTLGPDDGLIAKTMWATTPLGNFEHRNILNIPISDVDGSTDNASDSAHLRIVKKLYVERLKRPAPHLDDKILTSWNGLMISAFARSGFALNEPKYVAQAQKAADFVLQNLRTPDGRLLRSWRDGQARHDAVLDDYTFFIAALIDVFQADGDTRWLKEAMALQEILDRDYWDEATGGYYLTPASTSGLLMRPKPEYDGAEPSGNSVASLNLLRLAELTLNDAYRVRAEKLFASFGQVLTGRGMSAALMLAGLDLYLDQALEVVIVTTDGAGGDELVNVVRTSFLPQIVFARTTQERIKIDSAVIPFIEDKIARGGKATAYVCRRSACELPTNDPVVFAAQLSRIEPFALPTAPLSIPEPGYTPKPYEYDPKTNKHWDPGHGHWHDGPPPAGH
jgi:uncharacterized protein YyaL (SSP411 family)